MIVLVAQSLYIKERYISTNLRELYDKFTQVKQVYSIGKTVRAIKN